MHPAVDQVVPGRSRLERSALVIERTTGIPAFASVSIVVGMLALGVAGIGLVTDVATHIDNGRDATVIAPSHNLIVVGLLGLLAAVLLSFRLYPQVTGGGVRSRASSGAPLPGTNRRIPYGGMFVLATVGFALVGFPLDYVWHSMFGEDVTLWSPTHATMISGGSFSVVGFAMMVFEARRLPGWNPTAVGRVLAAFPVLALPTALSVWQGEFDYGLPQFQLLYLPVLVTLATAAGLVAARLLLGPGGALAAVAVWLSLRLAIAVLVGPALGFTVPRFFPYLVEGLLVEAVFVVAARRSPLVRSAAAGLLCGTAGVAATVVFSRLWAYHELSWSMFPRAAAISSVVGVSAAILAFAAARVMAPDKVSGNAPSRAILLSAALAMVVALAIPLPRDGHDARLVADVEVQRTGALASVALRFKDPTRLGKVDWFEAIAWQGRDRRVIAPMVPVGDGVYRVSRALPVTGSWKVAVRLADGKLMQAVPIRFPADPSIDRPAIEPVTRRAVAFSKESKFLMREYRGGTPVLEVIAYSIVGLVWLAFVVLVVRLLGLMSAADRVSVARAAARPGELHPVMS